MSDPVVLLSRLLFGVKDLLTLMTPKGHLSTVGIIKKNILSALTLYNFNEIIHFGDLFLMWRIDEKAALSQVIFLFIIPGKAVLSQVIIYNTRISSLLAISSGTNGIKDLVKLCNNWSGVWPLIKCKLKSKMVVGNHLVFLLFC